MAVSKWEVRNGCHVLARRGRAEVERREGATWNRVRAHGTSAGFALRLALGWAVDFLIEEQTIPIKREEAANLPESNSVDRKRGRRSVVNTQWLVRTCGSIVAAMLVFSFGAVLAKEYKLPPLDPANFASPQDNTWLPRAVGDTYVYLMQTDDELAVNEVTFTTETKVILGVTCTVVRDEEWEYAEELNEWFLSEATDDWYAWDNWGNVWYFGEASVEYEYDEDWNLIGQSTEGSWQAGVDGAEPGILMLARPRPGLSYRQEYYEDVAEDMAKVLRLNARVSVEYGKFRRCLVTKEWSPLEPGNIEHKVYAPGVGLVLIWEFGGKPERIELVDIYQKK